jgi:hypothetical protein
MHDIVSSTPAKSESRCSVQYDPLNSLNYWLYIDDASDKLTILAWEYGLFRSYKFMDYLNLFYWCESMALLILGFELLIATEDLKQKEKKN